MTVEQVNAELAVALKSLEHIANQGMTFDEHGVLIEDTAFDATRLARDTIMKLMYMKIKRAGV